MPIQPQLTTDERLSCRQVVRELVPHFLADSGLVASKFIGKYWEIYCQNFKSNQSINGKVFEDLVAISLVRAEILPFYMQAKVAFIPYVNYDFIIYSADVGPLSLSVKTSLRERWKQADLEAVALKYIHRKSKSFVITMDTDAVRRRRIDPSQALGIDGFILANTPEYDLLIEELRTHQLGLSPTVEVVSSNFVVTPDNCADYFTSP
jgi:hypothetical protein